MHISFCLLEKAEILCLLVYSPEVCNCQGWMMLIPGIQNSVQDSHIDNRDLSTWAIICCLCRFISRKLDLKWRYQDLNQLSYFGMQVDTSSSLIHCTIMPSPVFKILHKIYFVFIFILIEYHFIPSLSIQYCPLRWSVPVIVSIEVGLLLLSTQLLYAFSLDNLIHSYSK